MTVVCTFSENALLNINLHAAKYVDRPIFGALLGKKSQSHLQVLEAIPVLHSKLIPSAITKSALHQLEIYCKEHTESIEILGFYWSPAVCAADTSIPNNIHLFAADLSLLVRLGLGKGESMSNFWPLFNSYGMTFYRKDPSPSSADLSQWKILSSDEWCIQDIQDKNQIKSKIRRFIQDEEFKSVHDFEDHLVDISVDWIRP